MPLTDEDLELIVALEWFHREVHRISVSPQYSMSSGWAAIAELYSHPMYEPLLKPKASARILRRLVR